MNTQLNIVMPVYNEEDIIEVVIEDWIRVLKQEGISFLLKVYNDESTDSTLSVLNKMQSKYPQKIEIIDKTNSGHGPTILRGYLESQDAEWVFQVDSDNEMKAQHFPQMWNDRNNYDFLIGQRCDRSEALHRKIMTIGSKMVTHLLYGEGINDINSPYRLMRTEVFKHFFTTIQSNTFAPNIMVTGMALRDKVRIKKYDIPFNKRQTGSSLLDKKLLHTFFVCFKCFSQTLSHATKK